MPEPATAKFAGQIAVAGSVGRASTGAMIAALLQAGGAHTVQLDARYLVSPLERIRIDGRSLDPPAVRELLGGDGPSATEAGLETLLHAALQQIETPWLVASGVAPLPGPIAAIVFAPILPEGERSAAGVATEILASLPQAPVAVSALQRESALDVLRPVYPTLIEVAAHCRLARGQSTLDGQEFRLKTDTGEYRLRLPLLGAFQVENAATAVLAVEQLLPAAFDAVQARDALAALRLPGRMEVIKRRPLVIVDSNAVGQAFSRSVAALRELVSGRRLYVVLDLTAGLDVSLAVTALAPLTPEVSAVGPAPLLASYRDACRAAELPVQTAGSVDAALEQALDAAGEGEAIAVLGSAQAAGAARAAVLGLLPAGYPLQ